VRRVWAVSLIGAALLAGCGGGSDGSPVGKAVGRWSDATRAFDGQLESCGSRVYPTHEFFAACMRQPPLDYKGAAAGVRRAFDARAGSSAACRRAAADAGRILDRDQSLLAQQIAFSDQLNNAATDRLSYSGPPLADFESQARATISRDLSSLRKLGEC
jgi:hypothetical protein